MQKNNVQGVRNSKTDLEIRFWADLMKSKYRKGNLIIQQATTSTAKFPAKVSYGWFDFFFFFPLLFAPLWVRFDFWLGSNSSSSEEDEEEGVTEACRRRSAISGSTSRSFSSEESLSLDEDDEEEDEEDEDEDEEDEDRGGSASEGMSSPSPNSSFLVVRTVSACLFSVPLALVLSGEESCLSSRCSFWYK